MENFGFQEIEKSVDIIEPYGEYPEWMTEDDIAKLYNTNIISLSLISKYSKENLINMVKNLYEDTNEDIVIEFPIFHNKINYNPYSEGYKNTELISHYLSVGNNKVNCFLTLTVTMGEPKKCKTKLFELFNRQPDSTTKKKLILTFTVSKNQMYEYLCGKRMSISTKLLNLE